MHLLNQNHKLDDAYNQTVLHGIFAFIGIIYIISLFINGLLNYKIFKSTSFDKRVIVAIQLQCIGYLLLTTFDLYDSKTSPYSIPLTQLIFATLFIVFGFGIATLQIPAIYGLITGTKLRNIGIRMSWFSVISSIGRIIRPIFGLYDSKTSPYSIPLTQLIFVTLFIVIGLDIATLQIPAIYCLIVATNYYFINWKSCWHKVG